MCGFVVLRCWRGGVKVCVVVVLRCVAWWCYGSWWCYGVWRGDVTLCGVVVLRCLAW